MSQTQTQPAKRRGRKTKKSEVENVVEKMVEEARAQVPDVQPSTLLSHLGNYRSEPFDILQSYFEGNPLERLVRHQLESYNNVVNFQMQRTIEMFNPIVIKSDADYDPETNTYGLIVKVSLKEPLVEIPDDVIKVTVPKEALKQKEDAIQIGETKEVSVEKPSGDSAEVGEPVQESNETAEGFSPIKEVTEEEVKKVEAEVKEAIRDEKVLGKQLPENIEKLVSFMEETGGTIEDYTRLNADYTSVDEDTLLKEYNWMSDIAYGKNQWRMGDGQTSFNNFIYYTLAGFSEFDNFRSNQICENLLSREDALRLVKRDNGFKYDVLKNFSEIIGFNLDDVLSKIVSFQKLY